MRSLKKGEDKQHCEMKRVKNWHIGNKKEEEAKKMEIKKNRKMPYHGRKEMLQEEGSSQWGC